MVGMGTEEEPPEEEPGALAEESRRPTMEDASAPVPARSIQRADFTFELNEKFNLIRRLCFSVYRTPPSQAVYLQLFHSLGDVGTCINGRTYLGNTPTMVAGPNTKMRFGVVGMGDDFHTFHLHGHRWTILGPHGNNPGTIQNSIEDTPVSQFEDTRLFGPANSFAFFIDEANGFFRAQPAPIGEWHMHCHVLMHMDTGMMGSLLIVNGGEAAFPRFGHDDSSLPVGVPCMAMVPGGGGGGTSMTATVRSTTNCEWKDDTSGTPETTIKVGGTVTWIYGGCEPNHTVISDNVPGFDTLIPPLNLAGATAVNPGGPPQSRVFTAAGNYGYHCGIHTGDPVTKTGMWGIVHVVP
jgi:plastocyanin